MKDERGWISAKTQLCAVIGNPVGHSLSPAIHNAAFAELGLDYVYTAFRVEAAAAAIVGMRALENFRGLSVTIPHKVAVLKEVDHVEPSAGNCGAANTISKEEGRLVASSTDGAAALAALEGGGAEVDGVRIVMLGSGGAARAVAFALVTERAPASLAVLGIVDGEREQLVGDLQRSTGVPVKSIAPGEGVMSEALDGCDILVHCTPVGMRPRTDDTLVERALLREDMTVFDIVYTPMITRLLKEAEEAGCRTVSGADMFVNQAVLQFERWTGHDAPRDIMKRVLLANLGEDTGDGG